MLEMTSAFESDVQGNNLNLVPLVTIGVHRISTNNIILNGLHYKPILLNIPNVKSNIDIENRKYKISNANLNISNFPSDGDVFSDTLGGIINTEVDIYWMSPSCANLNDCLKVYHGIVRRANHDTDKVTLSIEDLSQSELHKDLPLNYIGDGNEIQDRYKNKPFPMVYGHVDKSPCVIWKDPNIGNELYIYPDKTLNELDGFSGSHPLWIYKGDKYYRQNCVMVLLIN